MGSEILSPKTSISIELEELVDTAGSVEGGSSKTLGLDASVIIEDEDVVSETPDSKEPLELVEVVEHNIAARFALSMKNLV